MSAARPWNPPTPPLTVPDIQRLLNDPDVSLRMVEEMLRDGEAPQVPYFGKVGNSRLYWPETVQGMLPEIRRWFADAPARMARRRAATMRAEEARAAAMRDATAPVWTDPVEDARRNAARYPEGFMPAHEEVPKRPPPPSRIGKPNVRGAF